MKYRKLPVFAWIVALLLCAPAVQAHSGKARFHVIVDTDGAADDLRTLCLLLGNREVEVLAVTTSSGALPPRESATRVRGLLDGFYHEGIPVGVGPTTGAVPPPWRSVARRVVWGAADPVSTDFLSARELIATTLRNEEEPVVIVALGALTNVQEALAADPALGCRIERIVWYDDSPRSGGGANFLADSVASRRVLVSGVPVEIVSANPAFPLVVTQSLLDSVATVPTDYARKIVSTHRIEPFAGLVDAGHPGLWDDLVAIYLFAPELFAVQPLSPTVRVHSLPSRAAADRAEAALLAILRGKTDSESRVFYGFPVEEQVYAADVAPIVGSALRRHGPSEWRAAVLTNELHGHLGIYATIGVKMGIRAREYFNIGVDDIRVTPYAGSRPPVSCLNDGLQVSTGATAGHGLIDVAEVAHPRPEARFSFKGRTIRLTLKPEYAARIRQDVQQGIGRYGNLTEAYWQYVRALALRYWLEFDRHELFELHVEPTSAPA